METLLKKLIRHSSEFSEEYNMDQIKLTTIRKEALLPNYTQWNPSNSKWKSIGVKWENDIPIFPDGFTIEQWDDGYGGSTTWWEIIDSDGEPVVGIKHIEDHQGPWGWINSSTYVNFS